MKTRRNILSSIPALLCAGIIPSLASGKVENPAKPLKLFNQNITWTNGSDLGISFVGKNTGETTVLFSCADFPDGVDREIFSGFALVRAGSRYWYNIGADGEFFLSYKFRPFLSEKHTNEVENIFKIL